MFQVERDISEVSIKKAALGKAFKKEAKVVTEQLSRLEGDDVTALEKALQEDGWEDVIAFEK